MKNILLFFLAVCLYSSCDENELFKLSPNLEESNKSYENQFKAIWTAIDINYPIWDVERDEYHLNWDSVYNEYLPKFREQDAAYLAGDTTCWFRVCMLYHNLLNNLHDGHINVKIKDVYTGKENEVASLIGMIASYRYAYNRVIRYMTWNTVYNSENENRHPLLETKVSSDSYYWYGHFKDDIVYLSILEFNLSEIIKKRGRTEKEQNYLDIWQAWFDKIQELHNNRKLNGVILDVRGNPGGKIEDYQYFLGALHGDIDGDGGIHTGFLRSKSGIGRYDYEKGKDYSFHTYEKEHAIITAPIVVLADSLSASMAEQTCLAAKRIKNAYVIGTKTSGALSPLVDFGFERNLHDNFTMFGNIGDENLIFSSFYINMPFSTFTTYEGTCLESVGVEPDQVVFDDDPNRDKQLDYALDYILSLTRNR